MRMIDADELKNQVRHMPRTVNPDLVQYSLVQSIIENMPTLTPQNEPLTLDELLTMDGEPVYVVFRPDISGEKPQFWALVSVDEWNDIYLANKEGWAFNYEKFLGDVEGIYRRPPERQEDT